MGLTTGSLTTGPAMGGSNERAMLELLTRQASMIAMLTGLLVERAVLTRDEAVVIAQAGCGGPTPGPTPDQVMAWLQEELRKKAIPPVPR